MVYRYHLSVKPEALDALQEALSSYISELFARQQQVLDTEEINGKIEGLDDILDAVTSLSKLEQEMNP